MADYRKFRVWRKSHELALAVHKVTRSFGTADSRSLCWQLNRAALSVPSNLAEGLARSGPRERARFTEIALGSAFEVDFQLLFAVDAGYLGRESYEELHAQVTSVKRMLTVLHRKLRSSES